MEMVCIKIFAPEIQVQINETSTLFISYYYPGGPLEFGRNVLIGTLQGSGYDCRSDRVVPFLGSTNGLWNQVSVWVDWIKKEMGKLGEKGC